jgi:SAM-dependent methyltransferase
MIAKPSFLGPKYGSAFEDPTVVASYHTRPPYPEEVFELLAGLLARRPGAVLDLGCGPGIVARRLVGLEDRVERVDALDVSPAMLAEGQRQPNGEHPRLRWILGRAEDAPLQPPYALVTAAASLHWMDWQTVLSRLQDVLAPDGLLVIIVDANPTLPWQAELLPILQQYSTNQEYQPGFDLVAALQERGLFQVEERRRTAPIRFRQSVDAYVESFHARSGFSRARMAPEAVVAFDGAVRSLVSRYGVSDVEHEVIADVAWGRPSRPAGELSAGKQTSSA